MSGRKENTQEIYEKRRMQDGKQAKEKIPMKPESRSKLFACLAYIPFVLRNQSLTIGLVLINMGELGCLL